MDENKTWEMAKSEAGGLISPKKWMLDWLGDLIQEHRCREGREKMDAVLTNVYSASVIADLPEGERIEEVKKRLDSAEATQALTEAAVAMYEAIDGAAEPYLAALAAQYIVEGKPRDRFFRAACGLLRDVDADELEAIKVLLRGGQVPFVARLVREGEPGQVRYLGKRALDFPDPPPGSYRRRPSRERWRDNVQPPPVGIRGAILALKRYGFGVERSTDREDMRGPDWVVFDNEMMGLVLRLKFIMSVE